MGADIIAVIAVVVSILTAIYTANAQGKSAQKIAHMQQAADRAEDDANAKDERRRFFLGLWDRFEPLKEINPASVVGPHVRTAINLFELVALLWQTDVVDKEMVELAFGQRIETICAQIGQIAAPIPGIGQSGIEILASYPHIDKLRRDLATVRQSRGSITR